MSMIQRMPMDAASDDTLVERFFDLAIQGDVDSEELNMIDAVIYARLVQTYGFETAPPPRRRLAA